MNDQLLQEILAIYELSGATTYPLRSYNNHIYRVERADGARFSLRICGFPNMKRRSMDDEMRWLDFVAQHDPRLAPRPIANKHGELVTAINRPECEWLCCLFAWIEGSEVRGAAKPEQLRNIGRSAAALHNIARQFPFPDATSDFRDGYRYDQTLMRSHYGWIEKYRDVIGAENVLLLDRAIDYTITQMDRRGMTPLNYGVIHADLHLGNVVVHDGEVAIMDFEQVGRGHYLYDLTVMWTELLDEPADFASLWQSFVAGYAEVAEVPFSQEEELNPYIVAIQLNSLDWIYNADNPAVRVEYGPKLPFYFESIRQRVG